MLAQPSLAQVAVGTGSAAAPAVSSGVFNSINTIGQLSGLAQSAISVGNTVSTPGVMDAVVGSISNAGNVAGTLQSVAKIATTGAGLYTAFNGVAGTGAPYKSTAQVAQDQAAFLAPAPSQSAATVKPNNNTMIAAMALLGLIAVFSFQ